MTNLDHKVQELRALAEKAMGGAWEDQDALDLAANPATLTAILDEYDRRGAALVEADGTLHEAREFINRYSDVRDGDYGAPEPNEAMQLVHTIDQTAAAISQEAGK